MATFSRIFDKPVLVCAAALALLIWLCNTDELTLELAKGLTPTYVPKQQLTPEEASQAVKSRCERSLIETGLTHRFPANYCEPTPQQVADEQARDLSSHRLQFEWAYVHPARDKIRIGAALLCWLFALVALGRVGLNIYAEYVAPALRRFTAPARKRNMEQAFLQMKLLHENGVLSDEDFAAKKQDLRAQIMAER